MAESIQQLERRIDELRAALRRATLARDQAKSRSLRRDLRQAEQAWERALAELERAAGKAAGAAGPRAAAGTAERGGGERRSMPILPLREQVHHVLTLLTVPTAARMIVAVHRAFFAGEMVPQRLTSLRRDEERSFRTAPHARPYYLCPALTADLLSPARGLLTVSTWTMAERIVGPLSPRVNYLISAIKVAEHIGRLDKPGAEASRLLTRFAANIPGGGAEGRVRPEVVAKAARDELVIHEESDQEDRDAAAARAARMSTVDQLFGSRMADVALEDLA